MKLSTNNFILWRNQITPLVQSLGVLHHLLSEEKPEEGVKGDTGEKSPNPSYSKWITNDGLLSSWLLGTMKEEVLTMSMVTLRMRSGPPLKNSYCQLLE